MSLIGAGAKPYEIIRAINHADPQKVYGWNEERGNHNTSLIEFADEKAADIENKSGLTLLLEDYAEVYEKDDYGVSYVPSNKMGGNWFTKLFNKIGIGDNLFHSSAAEKTAKDEGSYYQKDLFRDSIEAHGGVQYAKEGDDLFESAVNFANADIEAIGKPYQTIVSHNFFRDKQLNAGEVNSFRHDHDVQKSDIKELNFTKTGKSKLNAEEVASYILAADTDKNGIITEEESLAVKEGNNADIIAKAKEIYEENA